MIINMSYEIAMLCLILIAVVALIGTNMYKTKQIGDIRDLFIDAYCTFIEKIEGEKEDVR